MINLIIKAQTTPSQPNYIETELNLTNNVNLTNVIHLVHSCAPRSLEL